MSAADPPLEIDGASMLEAQIRRLAGHLATVLPDHPFLESLACPPNGDAHQALIEEDQGLERGLAALTETFPLAAIIASHRLSRLESDLLLIALMPELDDRFGDAFAALRGGTTLRRPTLGIALRALLSTRAERWQARQHLAGGPLWEAGLLRRDTDAGPGLDAVLRPSAAIVAAAHGHLPDRLDSGASVELIPPDDEATPLRPALAVVLADLTRWLEVVQIGAVHLVVEAPEDARALATAVARAFNRPLLSISGLGAREDEALEAALCGLIAGGPILLEIDRAVDALRLPVSWRPPVPALFASRHGCELRLPSALPARRIYIPRPRPLEQAQTWRSALGASSDAVRVDLLASRTHLTALEIHKVAALAEQRAKISGRLGPSHDDVVEAMSEAIPDPVSTLARSTRPQVPWTRLVVDRQTRAQLEDLVTRMEHRVTVHDRWGMADAEGRGGGLIALFHGESGTGKTLGVEAVATRLGLPLLRVDLSRVVSKYIGETEKHLGSLFDAVEGFHAVLFFDEADALFGNRTGVKDAHDRYANLETNYLLYRLESFEGIALLATNILHNVDTAFTRRIQFIVNFPRPSASLQRMIWTEHLPRSQLADDVDLDALVRTHDLVGGEIRNAAHSAAYAAAGQRSAVTQAMLEQAVRSERLKRGKAVRREGG